MGKDIWSILGLTPATLAELTEGSDHYETQPAPNKLSLPVDGSSGREVRAVPEWRDQEPVERIANTILMCALRDGASDIHIEPEEKSVWVRYRIAGEYRDHLRLPPLVLKPLVQRFKQLGQLDPGQSGGQWGLIRLRLDERSFDLRIATHTNQHGEGVIMSVSGGHR